MLFKVPPDAFALGETYNLTTVPAYSMKLHPDKFGISTITAYGPGWIALNQEKISSSIVIGSRGQRFDWHCRSFADLSPLHFEQLAGLDSELVLFGSGEQLQFPKPAWLASLMAKRIGLETMSTAAACRTYNILAGEGRDVVVALILESP
jgi:uncharacterized protein